METPEIIQPFTESVNRAIEVREANVMAFFIPTDDKERIECINPIIAPKDKMEEINGIIEDIKTKFDIGQGADEDIDNPDNEIETDGEE